MENQLVLRRRQLIALLLALIVGLFLFEPWSLFSKPIWEQVPSSESVTEGEQIFAANCAACHGEKAVGENLQRPLGGMKDQGGYLAPALNGTGHAWHHPDEILFRIIQEGSIAEDFQCEALLEDSVIPRLLLASITSNHSGQKKF